MLGERLFLWDWMKEFPPFRLDIGDRTLWCDGQRVPLTPKAFAVLQFLVERAGRLVTQDELLEALWPNTFVQPEVLKSQILDVRTALGDKPKNPRFIETVPRQGYRFIAAIRDAAPPAAPQTTGPPIVGRDDALNQLRECLRKAAAGERQIVFLTGEQGMGKTTLVGTFLSELNVPVARGQCLEGFGAAKEPYYPVLEALSQLAHGPLSDAVIRVLESYAPTWLIQLPPFLRKEHRESLQRELLGATRERMIRELCEALERLTTEPLVILFEDLHWSDHSTVDLISSIAYRRAPARLMIIGTYRPVDIVVSQHPLKQMTHGLKAHRLSKEIALSPLAEVEIAAYLTQHAQPGSALPSLAHWVYRQTEGNPLFMVTMIEHLLENGMVAVDQGMWSFAKPLEQIEVAIPDTLRQMVELQIEGLSPREQLMLDGACVQGIQFSASLTAAVLDVDVESVEDTCQKLARQHHIIRTATVEQLAGGAVSQRYEFVHAVFRGVFYHRLAAARRAKLHRRLGEALESFYPGDRTAVAEELAGHFEQGGDWKRSVDYLWIAARKAWQRFDYRHTIGVLEQALQCASKLPESERRQEEIRILGSLAIFHHGLHDAARVVSSTETLAARAASYGMPDVEAKALLQLATLLANRSASSSLTLLDRAASLIPQQTDPVTQAEIRSRCAILRILVSGWDENLSSQLAEPLSIVQKNGDRFSVASTVLDYGYLQWITSRYAESVKSAQETLSVLLEGGRVFRFLHGRDLLAINLAFLGDWGKALDILDEAISNARKNEAPSRLAMPLLFKAWIHLNAMDYHGVLEMCGEAMPNIGPSMADRHYIATRLAASAEVGLDRPDAALERLLPTRDALDQHPTMLSWYWRIPLHADLVDAWLVKNELAEARREAERLLELALRTADRTWHALAWDASARVAVREADSERAIRDSNHALSAMEGYAVPLAAWRVHLTASTIDVQNADSHLEQSREIIGLLVRSLESRPNLRQTFLSSPAVSALTALTAKAHGR